MLPEGSRRVAIVSDDFERCRTGVLSILSFVFPTEMNDEELALLSSRLDAIPLLILIPLRSPLFLQ